MKSSLWRGPDHQGIIKSGPRLEDKDTAEDKKAPPSNFLTLAQLLDQWRLVDEAFGLLSRHQKVSSSYSGGLKGRRGNYGSWPASTRSTTLLFNSRMSLHREGLRPRSLEETTMKVLHGC